MNTQNKAVTFHAGDVVTWPEAIEAAYRISQLRDDHPRSDTGKGPFVVVKVWDIPEDQFVCGCRKGDDRHHECRDHDTVECRPGYSDELMRDYRRHHQMISVVGKGGRTTQYISGAGLVKVDWPDRLWARYQCNHFEEIRRPDAVFVLGREAHLILVLGLSQELPLHFPDWLCSVCEAEVQEQFREQARLDEDNDDHEWDRYEAEQAELEEVIEQETARGNWLGVAQLSQLR